MSKFTSSPVVHFGRKLSNTEKTLSLCPEFTLPGEKGKPSYAEGYERWFDLSRILLPTRFCYEDSQASGLEAGLSACEVSVCPPLIPAVPLAQYASGLPYFSTERKKRKMRNHEDHIEGLSRDQNGAENPPKGKKIKCEEDKLPEKQNLILKLIEDEESTIVKKCQKDADSPSPTDREDRFLDSDKDQDSDNNMDNKTKLEEYLEKRRKNNASAKKSREARRMRELQTQIHAAYLEDENTKLRTIVGALRKENSHLRDLLIV